MFTCTGYWSFLTTSLHTIVVRFVLPFVSENVSLVEFFQFFFSFFDLLIISSQESTWLLHWIVVHARTSLLVIQYEAFDHETVDEYHLPCALRNSCCNGWWTGKLNHASIIPRFSHAYAVRRRFVSRSPRSFASRCSRNAYDSYDWTTTLHSEFGC